MKGTFFQKPFEFQLQVEGETWKQGDPIEGSLLIRNHGTETLPLDGIRVQLATGELKKVRLKSPEAFDILSSSSFESSGKSAGSLAPNGEARMPWSFSTDRNYPITGNLNSLFLLYGQGETSPPLGQIQLVVQPEELIQEFLKALTIQFRFVVKSQKSSKGRVEVKLAPPDSKAFTMVEQLVTYFRFEGEGLRDLKVDYAFQMKKLDASSSVVDVKKEKREAEQTLTPGDYRLASGRFNFEKIEAAIQDALSLVERKNPF